MEERYAQIPLTKIDRDPAFQVRQQWDPERDPTLPDLVQSLTGPEGLIHPIVVVARTTPTTFGRLFTLITGTRRLAAAQRAGWATILARILGFQEQ
jgi:ParB-like chromosome segregation protein Spo0J